MNVNMKNYAVAWPKFKQPLSMRLLNKAKNVQQHFCQKIVYKDTVTRREFELWQYWILYCPYDIIVQKVYRSLSWPFYNIRHNLLCNLTNNKLTFLQ